MRDLSPQGSSGRTGLKSTPGRAKRDPGGVGGRLWLGTKGQRGAPGAQDRTPGSRAGRDSPSQRPGCAPRGAGERRAAAAAKRRAGAPWWCARGGGDPRLAEGDGGRALECRGGRFTLGGPRR